MAKKKTETKAEPKAEPKAKAKDIEPKYDLPPDKHVKVKAPEAPSAPPRIDGESFSILNKSGVNINEIHFSPGRYLVGQTISGSGGEIRIDEALKDQLLSLDNKAMESNKHA